MIIKNISNNSRTKEHYKILRRLSNESKRKNLSDGAGE